jgi:sulfur-oxidizing protein SoxX
MNTSRLFSTVALTVLVSSCATGPSPVELDRQAAAMMAASFRDEGIATVDRLQQDDANAACSQAGATALPAERARAIEAANLATVRAPADGRYLGDWKAGEALAQSGRGMTWTDPSAAPKDNGGNCYNCHRIGPAEISHGTIGPSLYQYGKLRGVTDPAAESAQPIVTYTWGKLWNARAYNACSGMPRFGHGKMLDEAQLKHLMALLLDPKSPVNQ